MTFLGLVKLPIRTSETLPTKVGVTIDPTTLISKSATSTPVRPFYENVNSIVSSS